MNMFSCVLVGDETLLIGCGEQLIARDAQIAAIATRDAAVRDWAETQGIPVVAELDALHKRLHPGAVDWLLSIANLRILPPATLNLAAKGAINFHDGPLPERAGLNTPVWALIEGAAEHGITWHHIAPGVDAGDILVGRRFAVTSEDTAHSLNTRCYGAAMDSFAAVMDQLASDAPERQAQELSQRRYFARADRPRGGARLDLRSGAHDLVNLVRGLDFAGYRNPVALPKLALSDGRLCVVGKAAVAGGQGAPGTVLDVESGAALTLACGDGALRLWDLREMDGRAPEIDVKPGDILPVPDAEKTAALTDRMAELAPHEDHWRAALTVLPPLHLPLARNSGQAPNWARRDLPMATTIPPARRATLIALWALLSSGQDGALLALRDKGLSTCRTGCEDYIAPFVPLRITRSAQDLAAAVDGMSADLQDLARHKGFAVDLPLRDPAIGTMQPDIGIGLTGEEAIAGTAITVLPGTGAEGILYYDTNRLDPGAVDLLCARLTAMLDRAGENPALADMLTLPQAEAAQIAEWNRTETAYDKTLTIHRAFELQVAQNPERVALIFEDQKLSYGALNARANAVAATLNAAGIGPGQTVGLYLHRSFDLVVAALGTLKAGAAYVPLDPEYPATRTAHIIRDSSVPVILADPTLRDSLPQGAARTITMDAISAPVADNVDGGAGPEDLAYLIYTSGSTGGPKGVMVTHRNVMNFFAGMAAHIPQAPDETWLALTSMAFDISVLELFFTLARGVRVVISGGGNRAAVSDMPPGDTLGAGPGEGAERPVEFGLYYWGNEGGPGGDKYRLLLDGAKFADQNGFTALWTPERHFHAFGGAYPNPAVTGAAVAAVTKNLSVRAGSCVAPLHHPARIAEEWGVIDNLTDGRAGIAFASGWHPDDFVLRPQNTPPANKPALYETLDAVRKLWRGQSVEFARADGTMNAVRTEPRPISPELPVWVTTAGNPQTWREAGELGAHVLTHLLGQSIAEVGEKIEIYHTALRAAGHDPAAFKVTMMLHSFIAKDRATARATARDPMKDYLRSAAGLIKQYAWAFPAFKRPEGVNSPFEMDLETLAEDEMEAILDFAFARYFEDAGLFGTVADGVARVAQLRAIGVNEIACLIDYGIDCQTVLDGLKPLADVARRANAPLDPAEADFSPTAQILRHGVTHLQCTPSMARLMSLNTEARAALGGIKHVMLGGEALPGDLLDDLRRAGCSDIFNMYGPTETTIWSSLRRLGDPGDGVEAIGGPIANTVLQVTDETGAPCPIGVAGELWIGGDGVTQGYWQRPDLTAQQFSTGADGAQFYRTGDSVAWQPDGTLAFLGRGDHQVKIRGQRIELGEIETCLKGCANVTEAIVIARPAPAGGEVQLLGYYTTSPPVAEADLRAHLKQNLPAAMIPAHLTRLDAFPLTPNKKIDRKALPAPGRAAAPVADEAPQAPISEVGRTVADVWRDLLAVERIGARDNFFDLGGHSLLAVKAHRDIRGRLSGVKLSITDIFRFPRLEDLVAHLEGPEPDAGLAPNVPEVQADRAATMSKRRAMRTGRNEAGRI